MRDVTKRGVKTLKRIKQDTVDWFRLCGSAISTMVLRTHVKRWQKVAQAGRPPWDERNELIGSLVPEGSSVVDLGCGAQSLRSHLPRSCRYQPCDIVKSTPEVIFCDFNSGIYPELRETFDFVICSGVFEYIRKPKEFLTKVPLLGRTMVMSYNQFGPGQSKMSRLGNNWVNHYTKEELEKLFLEAGLEWKRLHGDRVQYLLYSLRRTGADGSARS